MEKYLNVLIVIDLALFVVFLGLFVKIIYLKFFKTNKHDK